MFKIDFAIITKKKIITKKYWNRESVHSRRKTAIKMKKRKETDEI